MPAKSYDPQRNAVVSCAAPRGCNGGHLWRGGRIEPYIPFCGIPPIPEEIWQRWVLDPLLLGVLALGPLAAWRHRRAPGRGGARVCFLLGWTALALALISPLCALSVALFSARATQHMVLLVIAAPLLAAGLPSVVGSALYDRLRGWTRNTRATALPATAFAALLWIWHVPAMYDATFRSDLTYWAMHGSLLAAALPLWVQLLQPGGTQLLQRLLLGFATFMQMGLLGALLTLSPGLLYEAHVTTTLAWGMAPLADQQLGGLIMWVPGCGSLLLAMLVCIHRGLRDFSPARRENPGEPHH